jgi:hypothetical protein
MVFALLLSFAQVFRCHQFWVFPAAQQVNPGLTMTLHPSENARLAYLPPDLREVCGILARGLLRLRSRAAAEAARDAADRGERLLHFPAPQRLHATRTNRRDA